MWVVVWLCLSWATDRGRVSGVRKLCILATAFSRQLNFHSFQRIKHTLDNQNIILNPTFHYKDHYRHLLPHPTQNYAGPGPKAVASPPLSRRDGDARRPVMSSISVLAGESFSFPKNNVRLYFCCSNEPNPISWKCSAHYSSVAWIIWIFICLLCCLRQKKTYQWEECHDHFLGGTRKLVPILCKS